VGANVGHYSVHFSDWVGASGRVFAFEPDVVNLPALRSACSARTNIEIREFGLSDKSEQMNFVGDDSDRTVSRGLLPGEPVPEGATKVQLRTGDSVIQGGDAKSPNVIKIDVEGHELSVLTGLQQSLLNARLRSIFVEVHFTILDRSGRAEDPRKIEAMLKR